jgi:hypothetical protein
MVDKIELTLDDMMVPVEKIRFTVGNETFTLKEVEPVTSTNLFN